MAHQGRKSQAEKEALAQLRATAKRPEPLPGLTAAQKQVWKRTVAELPPGWFRSETLDVLKMYCRMVDVADKLGKKVASLPTDTKLDDYAKWMKQYDNAAARVLSIATKMRITQQSSYDRERVKETTDVEHDPW